MKADYQDFFFGDAFFGKCDLYLFSMLLPMPSLIRIDSEVDGGVRSNSVPGYAFLLGINDMKYNEDSIKKNYIASYADVIIKGNQLFLMKIITHRQILIEDSYSLLKRLVLS